MKPVDLSWEKGLMLILRVYSQKYMKLDRFLTPCSDPKAFRSTEK